VMAVAAVIFGGTLAGVVARQLLRKGPPVWAIFVAGAFLTVASGTLSVPAASIAVAANLSILVFLFSLFVFAAGLERAGALDHVARWIVGRVRKPGDLSWMLFVAFGVLAAFVLNDALVLVGVPLLLTLARRTRLPPEPLLLTLAFSVTVGSVLTPFGNPQNLLVSLESGMRGPVATFLRYLLLPTALNLAVGGAYLRFRFGKALTPVAAPAESSPPTRLRLFPDRPLLPILRSSPAVGLFPVTMVVMVTTDVAASVTRGPQVPLYAIALGGAVVTLLASPGRKALLERVDWSILLLFAALFVVVAGAVAGGVVGAVESLLPISGPAEPIRGVASILLTSLGGAQLVSNVPWVGLQIPAMHGLGYGPGTPWAWVALAAGSTLAGNVTLLGAASNLIVVEEAERAGIRIGLRTFVRYGLPLAGLTVAILFACLAFGL